MTTNHRLNLYLIGFRGSGKTTIGPLVANILGVVFLDLDELVQLREKLTIAEIFSNSGEIHFRKLERDQLEQVSQSPNQVIACGGGIVLSSENCNCLKNNGQCIWLKASASFLATRIEEDSVTARTRPQLTRYGGILEIEHLLAVREPLYAECADYSIWVENRTAEDLATEIANWARKVDK